MTHSTSRHFLTVHDPRLSQIAPPLTADQLNSAKLAAELQRLITLALGEQGDPSKPVLVGLAAPQVGVRRRIILVDDWADGHGRVGHLRAFINPEVVWRSDETHEWYEGCYSTGQVCGVVDRPAAIRVRAYVPGEGNIEAEFHRYVARIFLHEIDHLNGIEFVAHITDPAKLHWVEDDEFPDYRNREGWRDWPHKCSFERWRAIQNGQPQSSSRNKAA